MPTKNRSAFSSQSNLTLQTLSIHTGWYVERSKTSEAESGEDAQS